MSVGAAGGPPGRWPALGLAALGGLLAALGQAPWQLWPLAIGGAALAIAAAARAPAFAGRIGWAFGTAQYLLSLHWIVEPFAVDPAVPDAAGWVAWVLLAVGLGAFQGAAFCLAPWMRARPEASIPLAMLAAEVLRMHLFTGFPWAAPGQALAGTPLLGLAALGGPHLLDAAVLLSAGALAMAARRPIWGALPVLCLGLCWGLLALRAPLPAPPGAPLVRLVQPGVDQSEKWDPALREAHLAEQVALSAGGDAAPALVVWPETSLLYWLHESTFLLQRIGSAAGAPVLLGANRWDGAHVYNAAVLVGTDGTPRATYDKRHLVPFGEYVPFRGLAGRLGLEGLAQVIGEGFTPGRATPLVEVPGIGPVLVLICYEAVFPRSLRGTARPRAIVQITNDAWFGEGAGPEQHLAQARIRAAESGVPLLRAANTGVTAAIDARGAVVARLAGRGAGRLDVPLPAALGPTPYSRTGDWPVLAALALLLAAAALRPRAARD